MVRLSDFIGKGEEEGNEPLAQEEQPLEAGTSRENANGISLSDTLHSIHQEEKGPWDNILGGMLTEEKQSESEVAEEPPGQGPALEPEPLSVAIEEEPEPAKPKAYFELVEEEPEPEPAAGPEPVIEPEPVPIAEPTPPTCGESIESTPPAPPTPSLDIENAEDGDVFHEKIAEDLTTAQSETRDYVTPMDSTLSEKPVPVSARRMSAESVADCQSMINSLPDSPPEFEEAAKSDTKKIEPWVPPVLESVPESSVPEPQTEFKALKFDAQEEELDEPEFGGPYADNEEYDEEYYDHYEDHYDEHYRSHYTSDDDGREPTFIDEEDVVAPVGNPVDDDTPNPWDNIFSGIVPEKKPDENEDLADHG